MRTDWCSIYLALQVLYGKSITQQLSRIIASLSRTHRGSFADTLLYMLKPFYIISAQGPLDQCSYIYIYDIGVYMSMPENNHFLQKQRKTTVSFLFTESHKLAQLSHGMWLITTRSSLRRSPCESTQNSEHPDQCHY